MTVMAATAATVVLAETEAMGEATAVTTATVAAATASTTATDLGDQERLW